MPGEDVLIAVDVGTSGARASGFDVAGAPLGGKVGPSRSAGRNGSTDPPNGPTGLTNVAGKPASILLLSKANGCGPR